MVCPRAAGGQLEQQMTGKKFFQRGTCKVCGELVLWCRVGCERTWWMQSWEVENRGWRLAHGAVASAASLRPRQRPLAAASFSARIAPGATPTHPSFRSGGREDGGGGSCEILWIRQQPSLSSLLLPLPSLPLQDL
uniref:Uncharacterized protein n=1 Tax=Arundo donax TaxID=35708 RepID=A0A0A9BVV6_ARUDO